MVDATARFLRARLEQRSPSNVILETVHPHSPTSPISNSSNSLKWLPKCNCAVLLAHRRTWLISAVNSIVVGAPKGRFVEVFTKLGALHAKSNFACAVIVGDFFKPTSDDGTTDEDVERLLRGEITVPLTTYLTMGTQPLPASVVAKVDEAHGQICENLFFLGKRGINKSSEGIRLVTLGGQHDPSTKAATFHFPTTKYTPVYTSTDAASLKGAQTADILITSDWPAGIETHASPAPPSIPSASAHIAKVAQDLRPRYHFVPGGDTFYERTPYANDLNAGEVATDRRYTRFIAIADFGNAAKSKALYAFSLDPKAPQTTPATTTPTPFVNKKRPPPVSENMFFAGSEPKRQQRRPPHQARPPPGPESCFFCLSYPQLEKHLIVSIGNESYLTTAKGPLTSSQTNPSTLPCSAHILIIPFAHFPTLQQIDEKEARENTLAEMTRYRHAIEKMLSAHGCGAVTFEIRRRHGVHAHWQVVPVAHEKLKLVHEAFDAASSPAAFVEVDETTTQEDDGEDSFSYWVSGDSEKQRRLPIGGPEEYFDLQFGRRVLAEVVGAGPQGVNWRDCVLGYDGEVKDAETFKERFKPFDFTMDDEA